MSMKSIPGLARSKRDASDAELHDAAASDESSLSGRQPSAGNLIVITGPSGVGKGTVVERLLKTVPNISESISVTTRDKRVGEIEGVDYFFHTVDEFQEMRHHDQLLEWAEFAGAYYGTPRLWVEQEMKKALDVLLVIEVQGAKQIRERFPGSILIFLSPPTMACLEARLNGRGTETPEKIALRLKKARQEMAHKHLFHFEVVNDNIDEAVNNLAHIIYAERCRIRNPG
jgi:guanylate kinase